MEWRIEQANRDRIAGHLTKDANEVAALQRQQLLESFLARAYAVGENHLAHRGQSLIAEEHVFRAAETYSFRAETARGLGIEWRVTIGAHAQCPKLVGPFHQFMKISSQGRLNRWHLAEKDASGRAIHGDPIAFGDDFAVNRELLLAVIDFDGRRAADAGLA